MPDAGDFEQDHRQGDAGFGWGEAFAALPQETPDAGGWQRMQARLPAPARRRARWPLWLATAASLVLAVAIPLRMLPAPPEPAAIAPPPQSSVEVAPPAAATTPAPAVASAIAISDMPTKTAPVAKRDRPRLVAPAQRPIRTVARPAGSTRIAARDQAAADLEPLYAQSAQLEGLLALARDDRVASGTSAALSDELDARVAGIDAALIQPGLSEGQRADLWNQRVDALQQLVGIEATNRLYAARGQRYDAALVSID